MICYFDQENGTVFSSNGVNGVNPVCWEINSSIKKLNKGHPLNRYCILVKHENEAYFVEYASKSKRGIFKKASLEVAGWYLVKDYDCELEEQDEAYKNSLISRALTIIDEMNCLEQVKKSLRTEIHTTYRRYLKRTLPDMD